MRGVIDPTGGFRKISLSAFKILSFFSFRAKFLRLLPRRRLIFQFFAYSRVNKTRLWHKTARPTLAA